MYPVMLRGDPRHHRLHGGMSKIRKMSTFLAIRLVVLIGLSVRLSCTYDDSYISGYKWLHKSNLTCS